MTLAITEDGYMPKYPTLLAAANGVRSREVTRFYDHPLLASMIRNWKPTLSVVKNTTNRLKRRAERIVELEPQLRLARYTQAEADDLRTERNEISDELERLRRLTRSSGDAVSTPAPISQFIICLSHLNAVFPALELRPPIAWIASIATTFVTSSLDLPVRQA